MEGVLKKILKKMHCFFGPRKIPGPKKKLAPWPLDYEALHMSSLHSISLEPQVCGMRQHIPNQ